MAATVEAMAKSSKQDAESANPGQSAKVHLDVLKMARAIVSIRGGSVTDLISNTCRPAFTKIITEMVKAGEFVPKPDA